MAWLGDGGSRDRGAWGSLRVSCTAARLLGMQSAWATGAPLPSHPRTGYKPRVPRERLSPLLPAREAGAVLRG